MIETNNIVYPVVPEAKNATNLPTVLSQPDKKVKKTSKAKKLCIGCIIVAAVIAIIIVVVVVVVVLVVLLNKKCRYGELNGSCIECGKSFTSNKIVGGNNAAPNSWPSTVYIEFKYRSNSISTVRTFCGGTLITPDTVITAAHCYNKQLSVSGSTIDVTPNSFYPTYESMYTVYLGLHRKSDLSSGLARSVKSYTIHPSYSSSTKLNDIAIIKLSSKVDLNDKIQVSCLPEDNKLYPKNSNINGYIVGWGRTSEGAASTPNILQEALITVYDSSKCSSVASSTPKNWNEQICAGKYSGGVDSCQGDSGGPLFVKDTVEGKQKFVLAGLTSYGVGCAQAGKPGIYTRVSAYIDWITKKMEEK